MKAIIIILATVISTVSFSQSMKLALTGKEWTDVTEYTVKGRQGILINQKLSFGPYHTTIVDRSWTKGSSLLTGLSKRGTHRRTVSTDYHHRKNKEAANFIFQFD